MMHRSVLRWALMLVIAGFLGLFLVAPLVTVLWSGLRWSLITATLAHPTYQQGLVNSGAIAVVTTILAMAIALPLAFLSARWRYRGKVLVEASILSPLILPPFVGALGFAALFGQKGAFNALCGSEVDWLGEHRFLAVCVLEALHLFPFLFLSLSANLARLDESLLEAARVAGAGRLTTFRRVILPLIRPGLFAGGVVVIIWSITELGTPLLLDYTRATPVQIFNGITDLSSLEGNPAPYALVLIMLAIAGVMYLAARFLVLGRDRLARGPAKAVGSGARSRTLGRAGTLLAWTAFLGVAFLASLPHLAVAGLALTRDWYATILPSHLTSEHLSAALAHPLVVPAIINSLRFAGAATVLVLVLGTIIAWFSQRSRPFGWRILDGLATLPLAVPGIILAFGYVSLVAASPTLRALMDPFVDPTVLLIIAYAVRRLPFVVRAVSSGLAQAPVVYEEAAAAAGAGLVTRLRRITVPLIASSLAAGAILAFSFSMLEVSDSLVLAQKRTCFPITRVIYELTALIGPGPAIACAFSLWAMIFLALTLAVAGAFRGRGLGGMLRQEEQPSNASIRSWALLGSGRR